MTLNPTPDRLVLELPEQRHESAQGIVMSNRSSGESPRGRVVEIGHEARLRLEGIQPGDTVFFIATQGDLVADDGANRVIIHISDVLAWASDKQ